MTEEPSRLSKSEISLSVVWDAVNIITEIQTSEKIRSHTQGELSLLEILLADFNYAVPFAFGRLWRPRHNSPA